LKDLVAYGQLVGLLIEFSEKKEVVAHVIEQKPEMVELNKEIYLSALVNDDRYEALRKAIHHIVPEHYERILDFA
jgi:hypothetical protein